MTVSESMRFPYKYCYKCCYKYCYCYKCRYKYCYCAPAWGSQMKVRESVRFPLVPGQTPAENSMVSPRLSSLGSCRPSGTMLTRSPMLWLGRPSPSKKPCESVCASQDMTRHGMP